MGDSVDLFVNGTLMRGLALHRNLAGAEFVGEFSTKPRYRLFSIDDVHPGMFEVPDGGVAVAGEIYRMSPEVLAAVEAGEPPDLYRGVVHLQGFGECQGILYPRDLAVGRHRDISAYGDWRVYCRAIVDGTHLDPPRP